MGDDSLQQQFGVGGYDGVTECVVEAKRELDVADRVVVAAEDCGKAAEMAVDRSVADDGAAGGGGPTGVRREPLVEWFRVGGVIGEHGYLCAFGLE